MVLKRTFEGIITPSDWDPEGNVRSISLQTTDEKELLIEANKFERELRILINAKVQVKGRVRELISGKKSLAVHEFRSVDSYQGKRSE